MIKYIKNNQKQGFGLIGIIIAVAVVGLFAGGGLYFKEVKTQKSQIQKGLELERKVKELRDKVTEQNIKLAKEAGSEGNKSRKPTPSLHPKSTEVIDTSNPALSGVEGWKTYRNEKYGFEFKYPLELGPAEYHEPIGNIIPYISLGLSFKQIFFEIADTDFFKTEAEKTFSNYLDIAKNPPRGIEERREVMCSFGNVPNSLVRIELVDCRGEGGPAMYALIRGTNLFVLVHGQGWPIADKKENVIRILSTFKFIK